MKEGTYGIMDGKPSWYIYIYIYQYIYIVVILDCRDFIFFSKVKKLCLYFFSPDSFGSIFQEVQVLHCE